jgi:hypothetical protein
VPRRSAELAVRCGLQADLLLLAHDLADRLVLDLAQRIGAETTGRVFVARLKEPLRAKQAPDVVRAERRPDPRAGGNRSACLLLHSSLLRRCRRDATGTMWLATAAEPGPRQSVRHRATGLGVSPAIRCCRLGRAGCS